MYIIYFRLGIIVTITLGLSVKYNIHVTINRCLRDKYNLQYTCNDQSWSKEYT